MTSKSKEMKNSSEVKKQQPTSQKSPGGSPTQVPSPGDLLSSPKDIKRPSPEI